MGLSIPKFWTKGNGPPERAGRLRDTLQFIFRQIQTAGGRKHADDQECKPETRRGGTHRGINVYLAGNIVLDRPGKKGVQINRRKGQQAQFQQDVRAYAQGAVVSTSAPLR